MNIFLFQDPPRSVVDHNTLPVLDTEIGGVVRCNVYEVYKSLSMELSRLTRDGTAEPVSRDQFFRRERGQGNIIFLCSAHHEQDWQPYPVDPYFCYMCGHTYTQNISIVHKNRY